MSSESQTSYLRVDLEKLEAADDAALEQGGASQQAGKASAVRQTARLSIIPLSLVLCIAQAVIAIIAENTSGLVLTPTLISVVAFGVLFLMVLLINPLLRLVFRNRVLRPFNRIELTCVFTALLVTSGVSTFGLSSQLIPIIATPWNPEFDKPQRGWSEHVHPQLNRKLYLDVPVLSDNPTADEIAAHDEAVKTIRLFREGLQPVDAEGTPVRVPRATEGWGEWLPYYWLVCQQIPWGKWIGPLLYWGVFVAGCYGLFYCLTYVVLGYWSQREKLIFPLARLGASLLPEQDGSSRWLPATLRSPGFWAAFAISAFVLSWNGAVEANLIQQLGRIPLGMSGLRVESILKGTLLEGLGGGEYRLSFLFIFTAIGLAFLLPVEISFSIWFYFLIGKLIILLAVWMGFGQTGADFPSEWLWDQNMVSAQGAGGIFVFSAISLARCISDFLYLGQGRSLAARLRLATPLIGLVLSIIVVTLWLRWNHLPLIWALLITLFLTLLTLGLMRLVAEGGIYWFQAHSGFFHFYKVFGLSKWLSAPLLAPLLPIYYVLFLDIKTFIAPNMLNSAKMADDASANRSARTIFHVNLLLCLVVSVLVAVSFTIFLSHVRGSQQMASWFHTSGPQLPMDTALRAITHPPEFQGTLATWYGVGGGWVALSMFLRRTLFWFPHPIGYVMLINPLIGVVWFSFFIGWICKSVVVKYGGKSTFDKTQPLFIGLIMGELMAILLWTIASLWFGLDVRTLTLNRYGA